MVKELMNPLSIEPSNFVVASDKGTTVGFGQIKPLDADTFELASVYVSPAYRRRGLGSRLVRTLLDRHQQQGRDASTVILLTLAATVPFYRDLGFDVLDDLSGLPATVAFEAAVGRLITRLIGQHLVCMRGRTLDAQERSDTDR